MCKKYLIFLLIVIVQSCNVSNKANDIKPQDEIVDNQTKEESALDYLEKLVISSNFDFPEGLDRSKFHIMVDTDINFTYKLAVYYETDQDQVGLWIWGYVLYDAKCKQLFDISGNLEKPKILNYDRKKENVFLQKLIDLGIKIPECSNFDKTKNISNLKYTKLPFNFTSYYEWQFNVDKGEIEDDDSYPKNNLEDNKSFEEEFFYYFGIDTVPSSYYVFASQKQFKTILMGCSIKNRDAIFYKIITVINSNIIDQCTIYVNDESSLKGNFTINEDLYIIKYLSGNINDKYQIKDNGEIMKIE